MGERPMRILVGISGSIGVLGIHSYLLRLRMQPDVEVRAVMTPTANRFVAAEAIMGGFQFGESAIDRVRGHWQIPDQEYLMPRLRGFTQSAQQLHPGSARRIPIEGEGVLRFGRVAAALDETIGKVGMAGGELPQCLSDDFRSFNHQFFAAQ